MVTFDKQSIQTIFEKSYGQHMASLEPSKLYTTVQVNANVLKFWSKTGISPLRIQSIQTDFEDPDIFLQEGYTGLDLNKRCFPVYNIISWRSKPTPRLFWAVFIFSNMTILWSLIQLIKLFHQPSPTNEPVIVGSILWVLYCCTNTTTYFVHFLYDTKICKLLLEYQLVEGGILSDSLAIRHIGKFYTDKNNDPVKKYMSSIRKFKIFFIMWVPFSFFTMTYGVTYTSNYPMNVYSMVPHQLAENYGWIKYFCITVTAIQIALLLVTETQTELFFMSFARTLNQCVKILMAPAKTYSIPQQHLQKKEILEIFYDSLKRYEHLQNLSEKFNEIFCWGFFLRQAFTMAKACGYAYLILKHPLDSGFPGFIFFSYGLIIICAKFAVIISVMGKVRSDSEMFPLVWKKALIIASPTKRLHIEERLLKKYKHPFGFRSGNLYTIGPQTILTTCSVLLTYIIIILQL